MTILTKPTLGAKPTAEIDPNVAVENGTHLDQDDGGSNDKVFLLHFLQVQRTQKKLASVALSLLTLLCLLSMSAVVLLMAFRHYQSQPARFHGYYGIPYDNNFDDDSIRDDLNYLNQKLREISQDLENSANAERLQSLFNGGNNSDQSMQDKFFKEEFDLDLEEDVSKIYVPDFRDGRVGRFLHDFKSNQTAIIDEASKRCFVMPLDREAVLPPKSLADLISKMYMGYYDINTTTIRKNMRVILPALEDLSSVSPKVQSACTDMNIYRLEKYENGVFKRSAEFTKDSLYGAFSGNGVIEYDLLNLGLLSSK